MKRTLPLLVVAVSLILITGGFASGQQLDTSPGGQTGRLPSGSYFNAGIDSIGLYNGNVSLDLPLMSWAGREISTSLRLTYNSQKWQEFDFIGTTTGVYTGGWNIFNPMGYGVLFYPQDLGCIDDLEYWAVDAYWIDGFGTKRRYTTDDFTTDCTETNPMANLTLNSVNGDFSSLLLGASGEPASITFKDGSVIDYVNQKFVSVNGNFIDASGGLLSADTLGRSVTSSIVGYGGSTYYIRFTATDANGTGRIYQFNYSNTTAVTNPWTNSGTTIPHLLTSIELPNGKEYEFEYDHTQGFLTKIILPTGAYIRYVYPASETVAANDFVVERRVSLGDGSSEQVWSYTRSNESGLARWVTVQSPEGSVVVHKFNSAGVETGTDWKASAGTGTVDKSVETTWANDGVDGDNGQPFNPRPTVITTTLGDSKRKTELFYNAGWNDVYEQHDSDWYTGSTVIPLTCTLTTHTSASSGLVRRVASVQVKVWTGSSCTTLLAKTEFDYDLYSLTTTTPPSGTIPGKGTPYGDRMNLSLIRHYSDASTYLDELIHYDDLGNVVSHRTTGGNATTFDYTDDFGGAGSHNSYAFPTTVTSPEGLVSTAVYNYDTGLLVSSTDPRGGTTTQTYELMNRLKTVTSPSGTTGTPTTFVTTYDYDDTNRIVGVSSAVTDSLSHASVTYFDKLYRPVKSVGKDPAGDVVMDTVYDLNGRAYSSTSPYRGSSTGSTVMTFDALDRPLTVTNPDSTSVSFLYEGNVTTTTDEAGNQRRNTVNGLGQLTKVEEPAPTLSSPMTTTYTYYVTGGLASVTQSSQTRTYSRDFLGRLLSETHPETGITEYTYDSSSRVYQREDARGVVTTYEYDDDDRLTKTEYSDSSAPEVTFAYDGGSYAGFLTSMTDGAGSVAYTYDKAGNLASEARSFTGVTGTFTTSYAYDKAGKLTSVTYPSGRVVATTYAGGSTFATGRLNTLTDNTTSTTLLGSITDNAAGQITSQTLGAASGATTLTRSFNSRFQLTGTTTAVSGAPVLDLSFGYGDSNNGKIRSRTDGLQPEHSVDYSYDAMQRLFNVAAASPAWSIHWDYDEYGNRTGQTRTGFATTLVSDVSPTYTNNRDNALTGADKYDAAGNVLTDGTRPLTYDGENRLSTVSGGSITYVYDGYGRRVKRSYGGETTFYLYGLTGLLSEFSTSDDDNDATAAAADDRIKYRIPEQTGTGVLTIAADGTVIDNNRVLPFGKLWLSADSSNKENFTSYQRDEITGLDYAMARDYAAFYGRFMSPDPGHVGADPSDPQSWNAYVYVNNDPINSIDPSGTCTVSAEAALVEDGGKPCVAGTTITVFSGTISAADENSWRNLFELHLFSSKVMVETVVAAQKVLDAVGRAANTVGTVLMDYAPEPRDPLCLAKATGVGATVGAGVGAGVGAAGWVTGPGGVVTETGGILLGIRAGGGLGFSYGWSNCRTGTGAPGGGEGGGGASRSSAGKMQKQVERGQAPRSVDRVDKARFPFEKDQVHFKDGHALNYDGTWKHGGRILTNLEKNWLVENSWSLPN